jgi:hypothetical protein
VVVGDGKVCVELIDSEESAERVYAEVEVKSSPGSYMGAAGNGCFMSPSNSADCTGGSLLFLPNPYGCLVATSLRLPRDHQVVILT